MPASTLLGETKRNTKTTVKSEMHFFEVPTRAIAPEISYLKSQECPLKLFLLTHLGISLDIFLDHVGILFGYCWNHAGMVLESF